MNTKNTKQADTWEEADLLARAKNPNTWEIRFENEFCYNDVVTFTPIKKWKKTLYTNIDQTGAIKDFIRQVEADAIDRTEKRFTEEWGSVVEKNVLASKIMDREIKAAYARGREEGRREVIKAMDNVLCAIHDNGYEQVQGDKLNSATFYALVFKKLKESPNQRRGLK